MKKAILAVPIVLVAGTIIVRQDAHSKIAVNHEQSAALKNPVASRRHHAPAIIRERHGTSVTTGNWSGYAIAGPNGSVTDVKGSWIVPPVDCSVTPNADASFWLGIDGYSSNTVEQIGTDSDCQNGQPVYYAWFEFYPHWAYSINLTVQPNDIIYAEVSARAKGEFTVTLRDGGPGGSAQNQFTTSQKLNNASRSSAEWVVEAPWNGGIVPLADFGPAPTPAKFGSYYTTLINTCYATVSGMLKGVSSPIGSFNTSDPGNVYVMTMAGNNAVTKASPSALTNDGGTGFTVTWANAGP